MKNALFTFAALAVCSITGTAQAQHAGDIEVVVENGRLAAPPRVFGAELGEEFPNYADEPGFDSEIGTFQSGSSIGFNILDALRKWDGVDFDAIPAETMALSYQTGPTTTLTRTTPATTDTTVGGFALGVSSSGQWHRHIGFSLDAPASDGIYLLELDLFSNQTSPALGNSEPLYLVFNQNADEIQHDAAIDFVATTIVPEPAGLAILACATLIARRRR